MSTPALVTMLITFAVVTFFMLRFLIRVMRTRQKKDDSKTDG